MSKKVAVLGGGVAGMSAAHELVERGFEVVVYEANTLAGGKARSVEIKDSGRDGRPGYPGEHGFRFFPRFYKHVTDTMKRIPYGEGSCAYDNLTDTSRIEMARYGLPPFTMSARFPQSLDDLILLIHDAFDDSLGVNEADRIFFGERVWQILTSCQDRRNSEYEKLGWWQFIEADSRSVAYQNIFGYGLTRSLVAAKANLASTKTVGDILIQLFFDAIEPGVSSDRVLNGPTNDVWISPWLKYLQARGVQYNMGARVVALQCGEKAISGVTIEQEGRRFDIQADYYIAAFPVEVMAAFIDSTPALLAADPTLANVQVLGTNVAWMNGAQFYLASDRPICHGHIIYIDSQWALTSVSQHQFWTKVNLSSYGDGTVKGILSVDISEWGLPGVIYNKAARDCTRDEIKAEIWEQLKRSLNTNDQVILDDAELVDWNLDSDIVFADPASAPVAAPPVADLSAATVSAGTTNREPLLVNLVNTWHLRPTAHTGISNLFLASDYVQTYTDLATMEGANEAARRAVNAIIDESGEGMAPCTLWQLHEPELLLPLRAYDDARFHLGLKWQKPFGLGGELLGKVAAAAHI